jgi:hypothetical protein
LKQSEAGELVRVNTPEWQAWRAWIRQREHSDASTAWLVVAVGTMAG